MTNVQSLVNLLEGWLVEELAAKERLSALVQRQERAVLENRSEDLRTATQELALELERSVVHGTKRVRLFRELAAQWKLRPDALSLSVISERAGPAGSRIGELRSELRAATAALLARNRRLSALVRFHRGFVREVIQAIFGAKDEAAFQRAGTLVDAEA